MRERIIEISLQKFRGATSETKLKFDQTRSLTLLFGENGSGKSTLADGLDVVCNKSSGSLKNKSSIKIKEHLVSIGSAMEDLSVEIVTTSGSSKATQSSSGISVVGDKPPDVFVLRRAELLRLTEAQPAERYNELKSFIDVNEVEKCEQNLKLAKSESEKRLAELIQNLVNAEQTLEKSWKDEGSQDGNALKWAEKKVAVAFSDLSKPETELETSSSLIARVEAKFVEVKTANTKRKATDLVLTQAKIDLEKSSAKSIANNVGLVKVLAEVERFISHPYEKNECPACQSTFDLLRLRKDIGERRRSLELIERLSHDVTQAETAFNLAEKAFSARTGEFKTLAKELEVAINEIAKRIGSNSISWNGESNGVDLIIKESKATRDQLSESIANEKRELTLQKPIKNALDACVEFKSQIELETKTKDALTEIHGLVLQIRHEFVEEVLDTVQNIASDLFETIHPGEKLKLTKLKLDPRTKGSIHQFSSFQGHNDVVPQAYFSESHLDTLGFCFWLAIAKHATNGDAIIVIDDAFTSVDVQHLSRIIDLLFTESEAFNQIIVTTHQRRWLNHFLHGHKQRDKVSLLELGNWQMSDGITVFSASTDYEGIEKLLKEPKLDRQSICAKSGVFLERLFDGLGRHYQCEIKRSRDDKFTLDPLYGSVSKLFKKLNLSKVKRNSDSTISVPETYETFQLLPEYERLGRFISVRNIVGAHFSLSEEDYSDKDVQEFAEIALTLAKGFHCEVCGCLPNRPDKAQGGYKCSCSNHPLRMLPQQL